MKKFTRNFLLGELSFWRFLRKIGLSMVVVFWAALAFGQDFQPQETYHVKADLVSTCYQFDNVYEVQVSMQDFILIDTFHVELTYDATKFTYLGLAGIHPALSVMTVSESTPGRVIFNWGSPTANAVSIAESDNYLHNIFQLKFGVKGYQHNYGPVAPTPFLTDLKWDVSKSNFWNIKGQSAIANKQYENGKLTVTQQWAGIEVESGLANCSGVTTEATVTVPANVQGMEYSFNGGLTWSTEATSPVYAPSINNTVMVRLNGCVSYIHNFAVQAAEPLSFTAPSPVYTNCPGGNGDVTIIGEGGNPAYTYYIVPDAKWEGVSAVICAESCNDCADNILKDYDYNTGIVQLPVGIYWVNIQDQNDCCDLTFCGGWQMVEVLDTLDAFKATVEVTDATCNGNDGSISVTLTGGTAWESGYDVMFNNEYVGKYFTYETVKEVACPPGSEETICYKGILVPGQYTIIFRDANGCQWDTTVTVGMPDPIAFEVDHTDTGCEEDNGTLWIVDGSVTGGTGTSTADWKWRYSYNDPYWAPENVTEVGDITVMAENLKAGVYYVEIEDAQGCTQVYRNEIGDDAIKILEYDFELQYEPIACYGGTTDVSVVPVDGTGGHEFKFSMEPVTNGNEALLKSAALEGNTFEDLGAGVYNFIIEDLTAGCTYTLTLEITQPTPLYAQVVPFFTLPPTCPGNSDGNLVIAAMGGTPFKEGNVYYYEYKMDNNAWTRATDYNTFAIDTAKHTILVRDAKGCTFQLLFDWPNFENKISFPDKIYNQCALEKVNLFNGDMWDDWFTGEWDWDQFEGVDLDFGFLDLSKSWWWGMPMEHYFGNVTFNYWIWTSERGWEEVVLQGVQQLRNPMFYISQTETTAAGIYQNGQMIGHLDAFPAGTYYVVARDEWGCYSNVEKIEIIDPLQLEIEVSTEPAGCDGSTDGKIIVEAFNGRFPIPGVMGRYQWMLTQQPEIFDHADWVSQVTWRPFTNGNIWNDSLAVQNVQDGVYYIAVRDYCGMKDPELIKFFGPITVEGSAPVLVNVVKTDVTCNIWDYDEEEAVSSMDGTITATATGGSKASYTYTLTAAGFKTVSNKTGKFTNLEGAVAPGRVYTLTVVDDSLKCQAITTVNIIKPEVLYFDFEKVNASCNGVKDGIIRYIITGGTAPYMESTNNGQNWFALGDPASKYYFDEDLTFDRRAGAGTYDIMIKDAHGCIVGPVRVVIEEPAKLGIKDVVSTMPSCSDDKPMTGTMNNGTIKFNITGGWNLVDNFKYYVEAKKGSYTLPAGNITYANQDKVGLVTLTGLTAGAWEIKVYEKNPTWTAWPNPYLPYRMNPNYDAHYANGFPSEFQNPDADCVYTTTITVEEPPKLVMDVEFNHVICRNDPSGTIKATITGGTKPYTLKLEGPQGSIYYPNGVTKLLGATQSVHTWTDLPHGHYNVFITDANGCSIPYVSGEVNNVDSLMLQMKLVENALCYDGLGKIKVEASYINPADPANPGIRSLPFKYAVVEHTYDFANLDTDDLPWQDSPEFMVKAGNWVGFVKDAADCVQGWPTDGKGKPILHHRVQVNQPEEVEGSFTAIHVKCFDGNDGGIQVTDIWGGNNHAWSVRITGKDYTGAPVSKPYTDVKVGDVLSGLKASTNKTSNIPDSEKYSVVFIDVEGCESDPYLVAITQPIEFLITLDVKQDAFICPDDLAGVYEIRRLQGGVDPIEYMWNVYDKKGGTLKFTVPWGYDVETYQGAAGLWYQAFARDANGCIAEADTFINKPAGIEFVSFEDMSCFGDPKATVKVTVTGEVGRTFTLQYRKYPSTTWVTYDGSFTSDIIVTGLTYGDGSEVEGHYYFKVTDSKGCTKESGRQTFVPVQQKLATSVCCIEELECTGYATITVGGGTQPYKVTVAGGLVNITTDGSYKMEFPAGTHEVVVTDAHGCTANTSFTINSNPVTKTAEFHAYKWEEAAVVDAEAGVDTTLAAGEYTFTYDYNGCERTLVVTVIDDLVRTATIAEVQGTGDASPMVDLYRQITGTVTGAVPGVGYFVQDAVAPWSGIWVADATLVTVEGNGVKVDGAISEVNGVTTLTAAKAVIINPPLAITPILVADPNAAKDEKYESVLVKVEGARFMGSPMPDGSWVIFTETENKVTVNDWMYAYVPKDGHFYTVTGVVNGAHDLYKLEPRKLEDIVDLSQSTPAPVPSNLLFNVYPNPFSDVLNIDNADRLTRVTVTNIAGQRVIDVQSPERVIRTSNLVSGVYVVTLFNEGGIVKSERIVKR